MTWHPIPGFSRYEINEFGDVRIAPTAPIPKTKCPWFLLKPGQLLKSHLMDGRYLSYSILCDDGIRREKHAHVLVALTFHGPRPSKKHFALHTDDNSLNNFYKNIRWGLPIDNNIDFVKNGKFRNQHGQLKFTKEEIINIRKRFSSEKISMKALAKELGVNYDTLKNVLRRRSYDWVL